MKISALVYTGLFAFFIGAGVFIPAKQVSAADCAAEIAATEKKYAASKAKYKYSEKLSGVVERLLKKARTRLEQGKKKGCFKLVKKAQGKIAFRENKAKGGSAQKRSGGAQKAALGGGARGGGGKAKCSRELKAANARLTKMADHAGDRKVNDKQERWIDSQLRKAEGFLKDGKYKKCRNVIKNTNKKMDFFDGRM